MASSDKLNAASPYMIGALHLASTTLVEKSTDRALTEPLADAGVTVVMA
ncbi:hypothetical protein M1D97_05000 [Kushneria sp. AK178]